MKKLFFLIALILGCNIFSQNKYAREFLIQSDNDLYVSTFYDKYYTNGLFLSYRYLSKTEKLHKKIIEWQIGHEMYTPHSALVRNISEHDRPFAAYLFGSFSYNFIYKNHQNLKIGVQIGSIGENAFGQELQNFVHDIYDFEKAIGWEFQVRNALGLNFDATYIKQITSNANKRFDLNLITQLRAGSIYTDASLGFISRFGVLKLADIANSIAFGTNLNDDNSSFNNVKEFFFFIKPNLHYVLYDATIQGSFLNTTSPVTREPINFKFEYEIGVQFTLNRFNFSYAINYQTQKAKDLVIEKGNKYGKILVSYLIH